MYLITAIVAANQIAQCQPDWTASASEPHCKVSSLVMSDRPFHAAALRKCVAYLLVEMGTEPNTGGFGSDSVLSDHRRLLLHVANSQCFIESVVCDI